MIDVLVVSAFAPELGALGISPGEERTTARGLVRAETLGVGPLAAAASLGALLAKREVGRVVFVGTAGVFPRAHQRLPLGSVALAARTSLVDVAELRRWAERPNVQNANFDLDVSLAAELGLGTMHASVATTSAVTIDDELADEIGDHGFDLEHLELAGVAAACARGTGPGATGVSCAAVLGVSNVVGSGGRAEWRANHVAASAAACACLAAWLRG